MGELAKQNQVMGCSMSRGNIMRQNILLTLFITYFSANNLIAHAGETHGTKNEAESHLDEVVQKRAWLQNYYTLAWMLTPGRPLLSLNQVSLAFLQRLAFCQAFQKQDK